MRTKRAKSNATIKYCRERIIKAINSCDDLEVLQYLEAFNRLYIEKHAKEKE